MIGTLHKVYSRTHSGIFFEYRRGMHSLFQSEVSKKRIRCTNLSIGSNLPTDEGGGTNTRPWHCRRQYKYRSSSSTRLSCTCTSCRIATTGPKKVAPVLLLSASKPSSRWQSDDDKYDATATSNVSTTTSTSTSNSSQNRKLVWSILARTTPSHIAPNCYKRNMD